MLYPPEKGASLREESGNEDAIEEAVEEKGRREVSRHGVGTEGENALAIPLIDSLIGRGITGGGEFCNPQEMVDNENRRRHLVVSYSLIRVGLFFSLDVRHVGEFVVCESDRKKILHVTFLDISSDNISQFTYEILLTSFIDACCRKFKEECRK